MDTKNFAIGILSTTAVMLLVGVLIIASRPGPVFASGMTARGGDFTLTVGSDASGDEEFVYVIDAPTQRMLVYRFNSNRHEIEIVQGIELAELRARSARAPGRQTRPQRGRP